MAKKAYIGVSDKARKVKKIYVGVNGVARKVKNGYVGISGVARKFYAAVEATILPDGVLYNRGTHNATYTGTATGSTSLPLSWSNKKYAEWQNISLYGYARLYISITDYVTWNPCVRIYNSDGTQIVEYYKGAGMLTSLNLYFSAMGFTPVEGEAYTIRISNAYGTSGSDPAPNKVQFYA